MATRQKQASLQRTPGWDVKIEAEVKQFEVMKKTAKIVSKGKDLVWGDNKMAHNALVVSPLTGFAIKTMHAHLDEIAPGGKSGTHRHSSEAILLCPAGTGYSIVDGVRHDWEAGDTVVMPAMAWHQHCNAS